MCSLAGEIIKARTAKRLSMRSLASIVGCSAMYISELESGKKIPLRGDVLPRIAQALGVEPATLISLAFSDSQRRRLDSLHNMESS